MDALLIAVFVLLLALSAFFSGSETALMSVDRLGLHRRSKEGDSTATLVLRQRENPHRMLSALLLGNNLVNTAAAALATAWAVGLLGQGRGIVLATGAVTILIMIFSEIIPKTTAALRPWSFSRLAARPIWIMQVVLRPVLAAVDLLVRPLIHLLQRTRRTPLAPGLAEIRTLVSLARGGDIPDRVLQIIDRGVHLAQTTAEEIMVPRVSAAMVERDASLEEVVRLHRSAGHSRFPVHEKDPDHTVGLLHISDVLDVAPSDWATTRAGQITRPVLQIPGSTPLHDLLRRMQAQAVHMAVVVDEYGGTDGIVTLEDVLEEVVGTIVDEQDLDREAEIAPAGEGRLRVRGSVGLSLLERETGIDLAHPHVTTVGGLIQHLVGRPAKAGDRVEHRGYLLKVERMTRRGVALAILEAREENPTQGS